MNDVRYPDIEVKLIGHNGNSFAILASVRKALRRGGVPQEEVTKFTEEATSGDRDHLLMTCMEWVEVS